MSINPVRLPVRLGVLALGAMHGTLRLTRGAAEAVAALPKIARALDQLAPAGDVLGRLGDLRGTIGRLEQLGNFVAEELPEAVYQLEELRSQLAVVDRHLVSLSAELGSLSQAIDALRGALAPSEAPHHDDVHGAPETRERHEVHQPDDSYSREGPSATGTMGRTST